MSTAQTMNMTDYDKEYSSFQWEVPEYFNFAGDVIDRWAEDPEKLAMLWVDDAGNEVRRTFRELSLASKRLARSRVVMGKSTTLKARSANQSTGHENWLPSPSSRRMRSASTA